MWHDNEAYLDYIEIRRRVERRLASGMALVVHSGVFLLAVLGLIAIFAPTPGSSSVVWANLLMTGWSGVLLLHGLWAYRNAGSSTARRLEAVQAEVGERLDAGDTELLASPRQVFRVQSLLDEDVRLRAGWLPALGFALLVNCFIWGMWLVANPSSWMVWNMILMLSLVWLPATYGINRARRMMRDNKLQQMMSARVGRSPVSAAKQKRSFDAELERYARLSDDGELVDMPEEWAAYDARGKQR